MLLFLAPAFHRPVGSLLAELHIISKELFAWSTLHVSASKRWATSTLETPSRMTASTAWYLCSTTLSSLNMKRECHGSGGASVTHQVKPCNASRGADVSRVRRPDVERAVPVAVAELDGGFFRVRTGRLTDQERLYLRAMAELGPGPMKSSDVAGLLGRKTTAVGPVRDRLVKRALCYSPRWGELEFTVPMFDQFMKRWMPWSPKSRPRRSSA